MHGLVLLAYVLLTVIMTWPVARSAATAIPGDAFDGWQNYWNLSWVKTALLDRQQSPMATDLLYYPTGVDLHYHTLNPFNGLASLPIQLSGNLYLAYNFIVLLSFSLSGYGAFLLALWVVGRAEIATAPAAADWRRGAAVASGFVAGLIFTFAPFHFAHLLGHMQVFAYQWLPFYLLFLLRSLRQRRFGRDWGQSAGLAVLSLALAALCDWYFVIDMVLLTGLAVVWRTGPPGDYSLQSPKERQGPAKGRWSVSSWLTAVASNLVVALLIGAAFALLLSPILLPMLSEALRSSFMMRPASDHYSFSVSVADFFVPNRMQTLWRDVSHRWPGNQVAPLSEHTVSIGYVALGLALFGLWRRGRQAAFWLVCALLFALLALGPRLHLGTITANDIPSNPTLTTWTPYGLLVTLLPFLSITRSVGRFALVVQLAVAVLAAVGLNDLLLRSVRRAWEVQANRLRRRTLGSLMPGLLVLLCVALILAESWVVPYPISPPDTPPIYAQLAAMPTDATLPALLNLPMNYDRPGYLLYQTVHQRPLTVAYISREDPRTLTERVPVLQHFRHLGADIIAGDPVVVAPTILTDLGVGIVVLDRYKMPGGLERDYTESLAQAIFAGRSPEYEDDRITLYLPKRADLLLPYVELSPFGWGALRLDEGSGVWGRAIGQSPAGIRIRHGADGARLRVRYRTLPGGGGIQVLKSDLATQLAHLPSALTAADVSIDLGDQINVLLVADNESGAVIEQIELLSP